MYCYVNCLFYDGLFLDIGIEDLAFVIFLLYVCEVLIYIVNIVDIFIESIKFWVLCQFFVKESIKDFIVVFDFRVF